MNNTIVQNAEKTGERPTAFSGASQRALEKETLVGVVQYWKMFREMLHIMCDETKLTAVDAAGLASGGIRMEGVGENNSRLILTLQIEEEE